jgi:hypothetical protein
MMDDEPYVYRAAAKVVDSPHKPLHIIIHIDMSVVTTTQRKQKQKQKQKQT